MIAPDLGGLGDSGVRQSHSPATTRRPWPQTSTNSSPRSTSGRCTSSATTTGGRRARLRRAVPRQHQSITFTDMALMGVAGDGGIEKFMDHREELREWHISFPPPTIIAEMLIRGREREYLRYMYYGRIYNVGGITDGTSGRLCRVLRPARWSRPRTLPRLLPGRR